MFCVQAKGGPAPTCNTILRCGTGKSVLFYKVLSSLQIGVYGCFLGSQHTTPRPSYFASPVFIYYQSILLLLQLSNTVLLALTCAK